MWSTLAIYVILLGMAAGLYALARSTARASGLDPKRPRPGWSWPSWLRVPVTGARRTGSLTMQKESVPDALGVSRVREVLEDIYREFVEEAAAIRAESREQSTRVSELMEQRLRALEERVEQLEQSLASLRLTLESTARAGSSDMPHTESPVCWERFEQADRWDDRYLEIVACLHAGLDTQEVAQRLQVDVGTVEQVRQVLTAPPYPAQ